MKKLSLVSFTFAVIFCFGMLGFVTGCCPKDHHRIGKKGMVMVNKGYATNEPSVFEYKRDGVTYLVFKDGAGLYVIRHQ